METKLVLAFLGLLGIRVAWTIIYNVFFHPLASFPGPPWGKVTRIPYWIACITGEQIYFMQKLHTTYGNVVRFSPGELSYTDVAAWADIFGHQKGRLENSKAPGFLLGTPDGKNGNDGGKGTISAMVTVEDTEDHTRVRRIFSPAFSERSLKQQQPLFRKYVDQLMIKLLEAKDKPVDIAKKFNLTTFDIMAELTLGEDLGLLQGGEYSPWVKSIFDGLKALPILQLMMYYSWMNWLFQLLEPESIREKRTAMHLHAADRVDKRLEKGSDQPDLWNMVLAPENKEKLTLEEMHGNATGFMVAGSETTATLLAALSYYLLLSPDKFQLLKDEVRNQAKAAGDLNFETLSNLRYLNACLREALRLYPPAPVGIPREISASNGGQMVCGRWIPAGTHVSIHQYAAYRSPENFKNPELFEPERWLGDELYKDDIREVWQPFSYGTRNCIGQLMAWHEMRIIFANVISKFDMKLCEESRGWERGKVYVIWAKKPLMVHLSPVEE